MYCRAVSNPVQLTDVIIRNDGVVGSSPISGTNNLKNLVI
jgi:hypothetical protein